MTEDEIVDLADSDTYEKYTLFSQTKLNPLLRQCPYCGLLCDPQRDDAGEIVPLMQCPTCHKEFCFYHSNAHVGQTCEVYVKGISADTQNVMMGRKSCPWCGIPSEKDGGCAHMSCRKCGNDWCWDCGERTDVYRIHECQACVTVELTAVPNPG